MLVKFQSFVSGAMLHVGALVALWVLLVVASYGMAHWCFKKDIAWKKIIQWISVGMGIVLGAILALDFLPVRISAPLTKVIIPYLICAAALHSFLLAVDRYMRHKHSEGIIQTRLVVAVITVYVVSILLSLLVLKLNYLSVMTLSDIGVGYLTRIAIIGLLVLEILGGRCKDNQDFDDVPNGPEEEPSEELYTSRW